MKDWQLRLLFIAVILIVGFVFGLKFAGGLALLGIGNEIRKRKKETETAEEEAERAEQDYEDTKKQNDKKIQKAGEDIEPENYNSPDDARDGINDFLNGNG